MNKEKLIEIILKDIDELKEISKEICESDSISKLETDIALSKTTIIFQEFLLLKEKYASEYQQPATWEIVSPVIPKIKVEENQQEEPDDSAVTETVEEEPEPEKEVPEEKIPDPILNLDNEEEKLEEEEENFEQEEKFEEEENNFEDEETSEEDLLTSEENEDIPEEENEDFGAPEISSEEDTEDFEIKADNFEEEEFSEEENDAIDISEEEQEEDDEPDIEEEEEIEETGEDFDEEPEGSLDEEPEPEEEKRTVGENFHAEKSVNDKMENDNTLDHKIANGPISSLQSAIGINDRFLFIREIFNNDAELFDSAIKRLDECNDIREAVEYLSSNFRIKKTEISLSFVELIGADS